MVGKTETGEYDLEMNFMNDAYDAKITNFKVDINAKINVEAKVKSTFDGYKVSVRNIVFALEVVQHVIQTSTNNLFYQLGRGLLCKC